MPEATIELIRRSLKGETFVSTQDAFRTLRSLPHGHVEAVLGMIRKLGLETLLASKPCRQRDLVVAMIVQRILFPCSKLATTRDWHTTTLAEELDVADADEDELYAALDWLLVAAAADRSEAGPAALGEGGLVLYDVSSSYYEGRTCPLAQLRPQPRRQAGPADHRLRAADRRRRAGRWRSRSIRATRAIRRTVPDQVDKLRERFGLSRVVLAGDRGMLTQTQIEHLKEHPGLGWISCLRSGAIRQLGRRRPAAALVVRRDESGGDPLARVSRRAVGGLLQSAAGRRAAPQARGVAGGDGEGLQEAGGRRWRGGRKSRCARRRSA